MINTFKMLCLTVVCTGVFAGTVHAAKPTKDTLSTVKQNIDKDEAVLVDVREKREWNSGHVAGAVFLPLSELRSGIESDELARRIPKDQIIYTHCAVGIRSCTAADILIKHGYNVRALKPGYKDLLAAGFSKAKN
ncbi:rhodanese-like domain-containing protein [uncultured Rubinisphaera sp.]|uniref:rhodanese-like domain-containing protein n=1 Tax=uncultured Rubinisphaera sp. TaxID=1678686 RepID=UPI0030DCE190